MLKAQLDILCIIAKSMVEATSEFKLIFLLNDIGPDLDVIWFISKRVDRQLLQKGQTKILSEFHL